MLDAIAKVRGAVASKDIVNYLTHYLVNDGRIYASDGRMTASAIVDDGRTFCVPADDFEKVLDRLPGSPTIELGDGYVRVKAGRYRADIRALDPEVYEAPGPEGARVAAPDDFVRKLRAIRPFVSDNATRPFAMCVHISADRLIATNNVVLVQAEGLPFPPGAQVALPVWACDYVLKRKEKLTEIWLAQDSVAFEWADSSWMRTQLINDPLPEVIDTLLADAEQPDWEIAKDWREAYLRVAELSEDVVRLYADRMEGAGGKRAVTADAGTPCPDGVECSAWNPKFLTPVVEAASHWKPDLWPKPTPFLAGDVFGLIIGRRA